MRKPPPLATVSQRVLDAVDATPGITAADVSRKLDLPLGVTLAQMALLRALGLVRATEAGGGAVQNRRRYHPTGAQP